MTPSSSRNFDETQVALDARLIGGFGLGVLLMLSLIAFPSVAQALGSGHEVVPSTRGSPASSILGGNPLVAVASYPGERIATCNPPTETVNFHSTVTGGEPPYAYWWDFGDSGSSQNPNPSHTYSATSGDFPVILRVTDANGSVATSSIVFRAVPPPCAPSVGGDLARAGGIIGILLIAAVGGTALALSLRRLRRKEPGNS